MLGNPTGEKDKSTSPNDAVVVRKADIVFKVIIILFYVAENPTPARLAYHLDLMIYLLKNTKKLSYVSSWHQYRVLVA